VGTDRVFVARLVGLPVYGPDGERIGRVRDLVAGLRGDANPPRVLGMVVEMVTRRRIFVPMLRVTTIDPGAVKLATGSVSLRRFLQRPNEVLVVGQLIDAPVRLVDTGLDAVVADAAVEPTRGRDWVVSRLAVRERRGRLGRRGQAQIVAWNAVTGLTLTDRQGTAGLLAVLETLRPADVAATLSELPEKRRYEVVDAWTTSGSPTSSRGCPRPTNASSWPTSASTGPRTCWRRWIPTTPPTCCGSCPPTRPTSCSP